MIIDIIAVATALSDRDLLARLDALAGQERRTSVELVAHLAALEARPAAYARLGYGSIFSYCTQALRLSEDATCNRLEAAKACRRFPVLLDLLADGSLTLTSVKMLSRHLTAENLDTILQQAKGATCRQVEVLIARLAPRPDVTASVRKLPRPGEPSRDVSASDRGGPPFDLPPRAPQVATGVSDTGSTLPPSRPPARPIIEPTAPERFRVQFTVGQETHDRLRRMQALLRREIPDGDPAAIFARALKLLEAQVEKARLGATPNPQPRETIRRETDSFDIRTPGRPSRHIPHDVKRAVWSRDGGQCAFVSAQDRRCTERTFLEFHHVRPYAQGGPGTVANIALRCRRHNQYEGELVFGPRRPPRAPTSSKACSP
jgi:5-methylcytosine-specific restriction endonuclease McrA